MRHNDKVLIAMHTIMLCIIISLDTVAITQIESIENPDIKSEAMSAQGSYMMAQARQYFIEIAASISSAEIEIPSHIRNMAGLMLLCYFATLCGSLALKAKSVEIASSDDVEKQFYADFLCGIIDFLLSLDGSVLLLMFTKINYTNRIIPMAKTALNTPPSTDTSATNGDAVIEIPETSTDTATVSEPATPRDLTPALSDSNDSSSGSNSPRLILPQLNGLGLGRTSPRLVRPRSTSVGSVSNASPLGRLSSSNNDPQTRTRSSLDGEPLRNHRRSSGFRLLVQMFASPPPTPPVDNVSTLASA